MRSYVSVVFATSVLAACGGGSSQPIGGNTFTMPPPPPPSHFAEFTLPPSGSIPPGAPAGITLGPDGNLWFADELSQRIGRITTSGTITEFAPVGAPVHGGIAVGSDGNLWCTARGSPFSGVNASIGRITPAGAISLFRIPAPVPGLSAANSIVAGPDQNLWFTGSICTAGSFWGYCKSSYPIIGRITTSGSITEFQIANAANAIAAGPDGNLWFTESSAIGRLTTSGTLLNEFPVATPADSNAYVLGGVVAGPDHNVWFTQADEGLNAGATFSGNENIYKVTTSGTMTAFSIPHSATVLVGDMGITAGPGGNLWFTDSLHNAIGFITTNGNISEFPIPTPSSEPAGITAGPNGTLWFTETNAGKIGRFTP